MSARYKEKKWPDAYWPASPAPRNGDAWTRAIAGYHRDLKALQRLAADARIDLQTTGIHHIVEQQYQFLTGILGLEYKFSLLLN